jgi:hypothetical protein
MNSSKTYFQVLALLSRANQVGAIDEEVAACALA